MKVVCRGAATLGGAGCAHVSAHEAVECSVWGDFGASDCNNDSSISHHTVSMAQPNMLVASPAAPFQHFQLHPAPDRLPRDPQGRFEPTA